MAGRAVDKAGAVEDFGDFREDELVDCQVLGYGDVRELRAEDEGFLRTKGHGAHDRNGGEQGRWEGSWKLLDL